MTSVGQLLRSAREAHGREIAEVAEELCITQRYLRAIEQDDLKTLPGIFFYRSFVRQYASLVGADSAAVQSGVDALVAEAEQIAAPVTAPVKPPAPRISSLTLGRLKEAAGAASPASPLHQRDPLVQDTNRYLTDRRLGVSVAILAAVLLACSGFYAWWIRPQPTIAAVAVPVVPSARISSEPNTVTIPATQVGNGMQIAELNVSATETTWLSITSGGREIFSGVLRPSETKTLTGVEGAKMKVGNAGGIELRWKGKPLAPIGARGEVRTIRFTEDNYEIVPPPAPPVPEDTL